MKTNALFKRTFNRSLAALEALPPGAKLDSEPAMARRLEVSRTTVRATLAALGERGLVRLDGRDKTLLRRPAAADYFEGGETEPVSDIVERQFMRWILRGDCAPGQPINGREMARQFGVSATALREYLARFGSLGLLDRQPNGGWIVKGFTREFALELSEVREMFELSSVRKFIALPEDDPAWHGLAAFRREHVALARDLGRRRSDFSSLDERFHRHINDASRNRFFVNFYSVISLVFHYHYQWNKAGEAQRHAVAIDEHLAYMDALESRDEAAAVAMCRAHMSTARTTLLRSMHPTR